LTGQYETIKLLLEKGANLNSRNEFGETPLYVCVENSSNKPQFIPTINILLEKGADINTQNNENWTPLHYVVSKNNLTITKFLVEKGSDLMMKTNE
jgi:ankyrin repeat protein